LILVDVRLAGDNGLQLLALSPRPVPAIVMTGFADPVLEAQAWQLGADFILKPISPPALLALIQTKLAASRDADPNRRWRRQPVEGVAAEIASMPSRLVDISYGGVRLEARFLPDPQDTDRVELTLPALRVSIPLRIVWTRRDPASGTWLCGAAVGGRSQAAWRQVVDGLVQGQVARGEGASA
jgi:DNA-binding response OmpR family regulator